MPRPKELTVELSEKVGRLRLAMQDYVPRPKASGIGVDGTGLRKGIKAAFAVIEQMRIRGFTWREVLEQLVAAELAPKDATAQQVRTEFAFQRRRASVRATEASTVTALAERGTKPNASTAAVKRTGLDQTRIMVPRAPGAGNSERSATSAPEAEVIRLPDGREFPAGTRQVPVMPREKWTIKTRRLYYGGNADGKSIDVPIVDIEVLLNAPAGSVRASDIEE